MHPNAAYNPQVEELVYVAGDQPVAVRQNYAARSPDPLDAGLVGRSSTVRLDKAALGHPLVRWRDLVIECDVYPFLDGGDGGDTSRLEVVLICPCCQNQLRVTSDRKAIEWIPGAPEVDPSSGEMVVRGTLSIAVFQCTWEKDKTRAVTGSSENLCRWRVGIDKNKAIDA